MGRGRRGDIELRDSVQFISVQSLSHVQLFATPWIAARQASLSITNSRSSLRLTSIESAMPSSYLILCRPLLLLPPTFPSIRVFSNESTLHMRWPKYWSFSFSIIPFFISLRKVSVVPFSSHLQSFPASKPFQMSQFFASGGQNIGVSASASVLPMTIQDWSPLGLTGWISLQSKGLSRVFSNTTVQKHQFFSAQPSSQSNSHIHTWPREKP